MNENIEKVLILAVVYNTYFEAKRFILSLNLRKNPEVKVILIDNSDKTTDAEFGIFINQNKSDQFVYLKSDENLGYFCGANKGLTSFLEEYPLPEWVIVCNVDIIFSDVRFFSELRNIKNREKLGVVAPSIISKRWGTDINPKILLRYSKKTMLNYEKLYRFCFVQNLYLLASYLKKRMMQLHPHHVSKQKNNMLIYGAHGSCIIFNRNYFLSGATLNHISFLFGEEIFVAEQCIEHHLKTIYYPTLVIEDYEHASTKLFYSKTICRYMRQSVKDILDHYYRTPL